MKKSALVLDTPKSCWMCPIATDHSASEVSVYCPVIGKYITGKDCESVSEHCPLRPLPEYKEIKETFSFVFCLFYFHLCSSFLYIQSSIVT